MNDKEFIREGGWEFRFSLPTLRDIDGHCEGESISLSIEISDNNILFKFDKFCLIEFVGFLNKFSKMLCNLNRKKFYTEKYVLNNFLVGYAKEIPEGYCLNHISNFCKVYYKGKC